MQTAFQANAFQNDCFQIVAIVVRAAGGERAEVHISRRTLEEERDIMELIMMFMRIK